MSRTGLGLAVVGIAVVGATVYFGAQASRQRSVAALKEKERQTAEKISELVEKEVAVGERGAGGASSKARSKPSASSVAVAVPVDAPASGNACASVELFGTGPDQVQIDLSLWSQFMGEYHAAKADLLQWVSANKSLFPDKVLKQMEDEIRSTRVMRPQNQIEPDLTWRGIAAWTRPRSGVQGDERPALIHVGSGFIELFRKDRSRARFEIARLLAQAWSPCEMTGSKDAQAWKDLFSCMGIQEDQAKCAPGAVAESTWAVSSAVASLVSQPGCTVPAFENEKAANCLKGFHRGDVASYAVEQPKMAVRSPAQEER